MCMSIFSQSTDEYTHQLVIDIESGSVGGSWVRLHVDKRPDILYTKRVRFAVPETANFEQMLSATKRALRELGTYLATKTPAAPENILVNIGSPWYAAQVRTMQYGKNKPFPVTRDLVQGMVDRELDLFNKGKMREWNTYDAENYIPLEHIVVETRLNGYRVNEPFGRKAERVELRAWFSMAPRAVIDMIENTLQASFHADIEFRTTSFGYGHILSEQLNIEQAVMLDIHAEITDGVVIRDGVPTDVFSLPFGTHSLVRALAQEIGCTYTQAHDQLDAYVSDSFTDSAESEIADALAKAENIVARHVHDAFGTIAEHSLLPHDIYVVTDRVYQPLFSDILESAAFRQYTTVGSIPKVHPWTLGLLQGAVVDHEREVDMRMIIHTLFAHTLL